MPVTATDCNTKVPAPLDAWVSWAQLPGGLTIKIRPLLQADRERERKFIQKLSERSRYLRMLTPLRFLPAHMLDQLMDVDYDRRMALVATTQERGEEKLVGIVRYGATEQPDTAELGITVTDQYQRHGIARLLIKELARYARTRGFRRFLGIVLPENRPMIGLAANLGFSTALDPDDGLIHISLDL